MRTDHWTRATVALSSLGLAGLTFVAVHRALAEDPAQRSGTPLMAQRLALLADQTNLATDIFLNRERVARMREARGAHREAGPRSDLAFARELLNAGDSAEAVEILQPLWETVSGDPGCCDAAFRYEVQSMLAVANMRLGEQENCIEHHGIDSCLLPIRGSGVHTAPRGSRAAIREYTAMLENDPSDLQALWLLNVASMTVGEYPDGVPAAWRIPPAAFESDHDVGRFYDVAKQTGLGMVGLAGGAILDDFDGDGYLDLMVSSWGLRDPLRYFRNRRDGTFEERSEQAGLSGLVGGLNLEQADYDNDGDLDVFVPRGAWLQEDGRLPNSLLRNNGDGTFEDVTQTAGVLSYHPTQAVAWGDYDGDGWLDLFIANESIRGQPSHANELYRNDGDGTFTNVAIDTGLAQIGFFKGATWGDYDNDGRLDLYVTESSPGASNRLFHNDGPDAEGRFHFTDVARQAGVQEPRRSFPTWFFDYDNDGWLDLFVSGYAAGPADVAAEYLGRGTGDAELPRLYHNKRDGTFEEVSHKAHVDVVLLTMGCNFGDLDNDGWLDFYAGTGNPDFRMLVPNRMFRNAGGEYFQDVTTSGGFGHLQKGHGVAFGDVDNDGDQDVFLKVGGAFSGDTFRSALFENPGHGNRWVTLELEGTKSNRSAIGARIRVAIDEPQGPRDVYVTLGSGSSFGASSLRQEIGLGQATRIREIEIRWPGSGTLQRLSDVALDRIVHIREGERPRELALERLDLSPDAPAPRQAGGRTDSEAPDAG